MSQFNDLAEQLDVSCSSLEQWAADLELIAGDCLEGLDPLRRSKAIYYLVAFFASQPAGGVIRESLGDASTTWNSMPVRMQDSPYGRMALQLAPCLASLGGAKQYTVMLVR